MINQRRCHTFFNVRGILCRGCGFGCKINFMLEPDQKKECGRNLGNIKTLRDRLALKLLNGFV
jgi:hypothetical protein